MQLEIVIFQKIMDPVEKSGFRQKDKPAPSKLFMSFTSAVNWKFLNSTQQILFPSDAFYVDFFLSEIKNERWEKENCI